LFCNFQFPKKKTHYFTNIQLGYLTANGFTFISDTVSHTHKSFSIEVARYIPLDSIKVGHQYAMSYQTRFCSGILFRPTVYELWSSTNDYWTNESAGFIEVLAWDGKTMEANIDFWATNISSQPNPETTKYREKHITGYFKVRVR
jgi:hypothetical protein